jgi:hypothetical protein
MIIFGTSSKKKEIGQGEFFCPHCQQQRRYTRHSARPHFSLYFIPLVPIGNATEYIQCETCQRAFDVTVLDHHAPVPSQDLATLLNTIPERLHNGVPVEYLVRDLTAVGLDLDVALKNIASHLDGHTRQCEACGLSYAPDVAVCSSCGEPLP